MRSQPPEGIDERRAGPRREFTAVVRGITKPVRPHQLAAELGGVDICTAGADPESGDPTIILADVDQAALEAAIEAHVLDPWMGWPDPLRQLAALGAAADLHVQALIAAVLSVNPQHKPAAPNQGGTT